MYDAANDGDTPVSKEMLITSAKIRKRIGFFISAAVDRNVFKQSAVF